MIIRHAFVSSSKLNQFALFQRTMANVMITYVENVNSILLDTSVASDFIASLPNMLNMRLEQNSMNGEKWEYDKVACIKAMREVSQGIPVNVRVSSFISNNNALKRALEHNANYAEITGLMTFGQRMGLKEVKDFIDVWVAGYMEFCDIR